MQHEDKAAGHCVDGAATVGGVGLQAGREAGLADGGGDESGHAENEEDAKDREDGAEGAVHS